MIKNLNQILKRVSTRFSQLYPERTIICVYLNNYSFLNINDETCNLKIKGIYIPSLLEIESDKLVSIVNFSINKIINIELISVQNFFNLLIKENYKLVEILYSSKEKFCFNHDIFNNLKKEFTILKMMEHNKNYDKKVFDERINKISYHFHHSLKINYRLLKDVEKKAFLVGGAVRDKILKSPVRDLDYVLVNSFEEELLPLGFYKVGKSFNVYLHPINKQEYVLLRGQNNRDDLIEDLKSRDLTINSMAMDSNGMIIDPFNGQLDLKNKILRHTSEHFKDDPLRVYRVARFKSIFSDFKIDKNTLKEMKKISLLDSFSEIAGERILKELKKCFYSKRPSLFFEALKEAECLERAFPEIYNLIDIPQREDYHPEGCCYTHTMLVLDAARKLTKNIRVLVSALLHDLGKAVTPKNILPRHIGHEGRGVPLVEEFCIKFKMSSDTLRLAKFTCKNHLKAHKILEMRPAKIFRLLKEGDYRRNPDLIRNFVLVCRADNLGKLSKSQYVQGEFILECQEELIKTKVQDIVNGSINESTVAIGYSKIIATIKKKYLNLNK